MKLTPPTQVTFLIALILGVLGIVGKFISLPLISPHAFWLVVLGWLVLVLGNVMKGL